MKITNRLGLPQPIVEVLARDDYSKGDADFSVTEHPKEAHALSLVIHAWEEL